MKTVCANETLASVKEYQKGLVPRKDSSNSGGNKARAAARTIQVLEYFRNHGQPARTVEIGRALNIPNSSADDLLKALHAAGYLCYDDRAKSYIPSYHVVRLAEEFMGRFPSLAHIHQIERIVHQETGQTVLVAVQEGAMLRVISVLNGEYKERLTSIGCKTPLAHYDEQFGWIPTSNFAGALLAANSDLEIVEILSQLEQPNRLTNFKLLLDRVRLIRNRGIADQELKNRTSIAVCASWLGKSREAPTTAIGCIGYSRNFSDWRRHFVSSSKKAQIRGHVTA